MMSSPVWKPLSWRGHARCRRRWLSWAAVSDIFPSKRNRKHRWGGRRRDKEYARASGVARARNDSPSVLGHGFVGEVEQRFGKGKFQHDLAFIVGHFQHRI